VTNWLSWKMLEKLGVAADMLCGQSQGEMAALCASGIFDIQEIIPRFWEALAVSPIYAGKGRLAFVQATEAQLTRHLASFPTVSIAIHVAPQAQVVGGEESEIDALGRQLRDDHILTQVLPYPPIHTPQLSYLRDELMQVIDAEITFGEPKIPIYSAVTEDVFPRDPDAIRATALANLDQPVRFWQTINKMYDAGARVFVQVGGGSIAANIKTVLPKDDIVGTAVDLDHRDPITQLNHLCATLLTAGVRFQPVRLFEHRELRQVDWRNGSQSAPPQQTGMPLRFDWTPFGVPQQQDAKEATETEQSESIAVEGVVTPPAETPLPNTPPAPAERRMPFIDSISEFVPNERITVEHLLDINGDLFLRDHVFIHAPGVKPIENCLPVLPLTMILEAMAETAACLAPGLGVIGLENVSAQRWVALEDRPSMPIQLRGERLPDVGDGATRIRVQVDAEEITRATAVVLLAANYQQRIDIAFPPITGQMEWPFEADEVYRDAHIFHGPEFQAVSQLLEFGNNGCTAELTVLPKDRLFASTSTPELLLDPVILDATAQAVGLWAVALGVSILPSGLERIEFYRPTPPPGTRVICRTHVTQVDTNKRIVRSNTEVIDQNGLVWLRIVGFKDWLYRYPEQTRNFRRKPQEYCISEGQSLAAIPKGSICRSVARPAVQDVTISWLQRLFLHEDEREEFERLKLPKRQWEWMMGRIAAKDAVRVWHAREIGAGRMLHPAAFAILKDERSRPYVAPSAMIPNPPSISISHSMDRAVAIAGTSPVGIDLETSHPDPAVVEFACSNAEREIIHAESTNRPEASWPARLWAAKEAAGKAMGTGLNGRPTDFEAIDWEDDGQFVIVHHPTRNRFVVATHLDNGNVIAVTSYDNSWNGSNGELEHEFAK
jgi:malonyl CoA-acyl carrier protein transacylase/phosphopantetheinyl transferase